MPRVGNGLRLLHVIPSVAFSGGGPSAAIRAMETVLRQAGVDTLTVTTDHGWQEPGGPPMGSRAGVEREGRRYFPLQTGFYKASLPMGRWLRSAVRDFDLVHVHALFSYASTVACQMARGQGVPYVIRPLGVLNRYGITHRRPILKQLSLRWVEGPNLRGAGGMHYTSRAEHREAEAAGASARPFVIPLGLDLAPFATMPAREAFEAEWPVARGREIVLFLSRIDPKKGLETLLEAFAGVRASCPHALLVVAGEGPAPYVASLKARAETLGIGQDTLWVGHLAGDRKLAALGGASVFVLPSHSENFGIAAVEALAAGVPAILSDGVAVAEEVAAAGAGRQVPRTAADFGAAIRELLGDEAGRRRMSAAARELAWRSYSLEAMGKGLVEMYQAVLGTARRA